MKLNVLIITGTRADYGILKPLIYKLKNDNFFNTKILITGMHTLEKYGNTVDLIKKDFNVDSIIQLNNEGNMITWLNEEIYGIYEYLKNEKIDLIIVLGDRGEPFAGAIAAMHLNIPIAHIHGGDTTGHMPDEYLRNCITKSSNIHFVATKEHYKKVKKMGENPKYIFNVGALCFDEIVNTKLLTKNELNNNFGFKIDNKILLFILHPSSIDLPNVTYIKQVEICLGAIEKFLGEKIIIYPNSDEGSDYFIKAIEKYKGIKGYNIYKNLDRKIYLSLLKNCDILVGNSSSGIIETELFQTFTLNIGNRQKGRVHGTNVIDIDYDIEKISDSINYGVNNKSIKNKKVYYKPNTVNNMVKIIKKIDYKILTKEKFIF